MKQYRVWTLAVILFVAGVLTACGGGGGGGGGGSDVPTVSSDLVVAVDASNGPQVLQAVSGQTFTFDGGVPAFGTVGTTTLAITAAGGTPTFTVASGGGTAAGSVEFGSCIFVVRSSTIPSLPVGARVRISPCSIRADIGGQPALGRSVDTAVVIVLGDRTSRPVRLPVSISESGVVTVGNTQIGRANLTRVTGATGATGGAGG